MRNEKRLLVTCCLAFICLNFSGLTSCSSIDCPVQSTVAGYYGVKQYDQWGGLVADTLTDTLYVWTQRSDGTDTLLLNRAVGKTEFQLPVSYQHPEDILVFYIADTNHYWTLDTVWMKKDDIPHFESVDCSAHFFHTITAVRSSHHGIDTITIDNPSVTYATDVTNLNIVFRGRPQPETETETETETDDNDNEATEE